MDQGVTSPTAIGVTGVSYGGIQTLNLARLRNRVRLEDGSFVPWTSPNGTPLSITAGYARWAASDLTYALQPNGRFLDFRTPRPNDAIRPGGVMKKSYNDVLYASGNASGFYAPPGGPFGSDITTWKALADRGEPATPETLAVGRELTEFHSWMGLSGPSAALLVQNGWTDDLFPAPEALRVYRTFQAAPGARVALQLGDLGHPRGTNDDGPNGEMHGQMIRFFDHYLKRQNAPRGTAASSRSPRVPGGAPQHRARHPGRELGAAPSADRSRCAAAAPCGSTRARATRRRRGRSTRSGARARARR